MYPDEADWVTGLRPFEGVAERNAAQQTENIAKASLSWYKRDYEADQMELMGDSELNQVLDDFYDESAGEPNGKIPGQSLPPAELYRPQLLNGMPDNHSVLVKNSVPYDVQSVCNSLDPRLYLKNPIGCGCNQGSRPAPAEITHVPSCSTTEARSQSWNYSESIQGCGRQGNSPALTATFETKPAEMISSAGLKESVECGETGRTENFLPVAQYAFLETARNRAAPKREAPFVTTQEYQSSVPSERENTFNIQDWVHDQL